jgi:hypothetical protein
VLATVILCCALRYCGLWGRMLLTCSYIVVCLRAARSIVSAAVDLSSFRWDTIQDLHVYHTPSSEGAEKIAAFDMVRLSAFYSVFVCSNSSLLLTIIVCVYTYGYVRGWVCPCVCALLLLSS